MSPDSDKVEVEAEVEAPDAEECTASGDPKACADCYTTKTPLWRGGPTGPKSLCNACGIRYRKRRRVAMGLDPEVKRKPKRDESTAAAAEANDEDGNGGKPRAAAAAKTQTVELHMVGFAKDAVLKQRRRMRRRKRSCLGEEERAAILLMALSSGVIYA
ncbi:hypothetical protein QYE76_058496 [Lolium multiflorum]|uniref:GATA-type domain-containing protein n=1 Tax=Lolium multiflorum TaxID=4521 RepID=A0AAD8T5R3_LOLMU|nr:hypothetical protein QYE76_058496 [Lolium multiflorum]